MISLKFGWPYDRWYVLQNFSLLIEQLCHPTLNKVVLGLVVKIISQTYQKIKNRISKP